VGEADDPYDCQFVSLSTYQSGNISRVIDTTVSIVGFLGSHPLLLSYSFLFQFKRGK
jgi:hypothetical protein